MTAPGATSPNHPIRRIVVVGGGIVAWSAAAAFKRRMPWLNVAVLPHPVSAAALADTMVPSLPSIMGFHTDLGLADIDAVGRTGSNLRLGTRFVGWSQSVPEYFHSYGPVGRAFGGTSFHLHWARLAHAGRAAPFDSHAPAVALSKAGRLVPAAAAGDGLFADVEAGLHIDVPRYLAMIEAFARHCGVQSVAGQFAGVERAADGAISAIALAHGASVHADLYVDATGPAALLCDTAQTGWDDWSARPGCDRLITGTAAAPVPMPLYDTVTAIDAGWHWAAATLAGSVHGLCYASRWCDDATASRILQGTGAVQTGHTPVTLAAGTRPAPWHRNCVAIGDAATVIEPLEWANLHLAHSAIDRIVAMLPAADCAPVELGEYNRQTAAEANRVGDFVALHYATARRDGAFWRAAAGAPLSSGLAHTLALFRERGRLPVHEEETFSRDSWLAVLFGQGVLPARIDPLVEAIAADDVAASMAALRQAIVQGMAEFPTHAAWLAAQTRHLVS